MLSRMKKKKFVIPLIIAAFILILIAICSISIGSEKNEQPREFTRVYDLLDGLEAEKTDDIEFGYGTSPKVEDRVKTNKKEFIEPIMSDLYALSLESVENNSGDYNEIIEMSLYRSNDYVAIHKIRIYGNVNENIYLIETFDNNESSYWKVVDGEDACKDLFDRCAFRYENGPMAEYPDT